MKNKLIWVALFAAAILVTVLYHARKVVATPSVGFVGTTLAQGRFGAIDVTGSFVPPGFSTTGKGTVWTAFERTTAQSDVYVQSNVWQPGGSTGWHTHPGPSLIVVTAGAVTDYEGHDPKCAPHVYTQGMGFVDPGGSHLHIIRNEGTVEADTIAVQLIPANEARRIDAPDPGNCHFPN